VALTVGVERLDSVDARRLLAELDTYLNGLYPPESNFLDLGAGEVTNGVGAFMVARADGVAVGCGAVRLRSADTAEIKRMFVLPSARGRGVGRVVLEELEAWAAAAGASRLVLETGDLQPEALRLYDRAGFRPIPCFEEYAGAPLSRCFEKGIGYGGML
jgi:putative acetyltransferase